MIQWLVVMICMVVAGCASKEETSADATKKLDANFSPKVGEATKNDLVEHFGNPEWCRPEDNGEETCRFHRKMATKWIGEKREKKSYDTFDELMALFDVSGKLKDLKVKAQR